MSATAHPSDQMHIPEAGDKGAGSPLFNISEMGILPNVIKGMFSTAENTVAQVFGDKSQMLPYSGAGSENQKV